MNRAPQAKASDLQRQVDEAILAFFSPTSVVVNKDCRIAEIRGDAARFGIPAASLALPEDSLGAAIRKLVVGLVPGEEIVDGVRIVLLPLKSPDFFCVVLQTAEDPDRRRVRELGAELLASQEYLSTVLSDYEATTEVLRTAHEELRCANEELIHVNHEMTFSNEHLTRLNASLEKRTQELQRLNDELVTWLTSAAIPSILLDKDLHIRRFTAQAGRLFNLREGDIGKPIRDARTSIGLSELEPTFLTVFDTLIPWSRFVQDPDGRHFSLVVRPYRSADGKISGVVLTLIEAAPHTSSGV